jgi:serine/threonine-protein kinase
MHRRTFRFTLLLLVGLAPALAPRAALAEPTPADKAAAQALFEDALKLIARNEHEQACRKLEESERLDAAMGTRFRLAQCYEAIGRTASAWAGYVEVADLARASGQTAREKTARARALDLEPRLSRLTIDVAAPDVEGLEVRRDGLVVGHAQWGTAIPIDPGTHRVSASAPGRTTWTGEVTIAQDASAVSVGVPALVEERVAVVPFAPPSPAPLPEARSGDGQRMAGLVVLGAGVLGLGASGVLGLLAKSSYDDGVGTHCQGEVCDAEGKSTTDSARRLGQVATVVLAASAVTVVSGAVIWLTAPQRRGPAAPAKAELRVRAAPQAVFFEGVF